jgi:hypothetical protein
MTELIAGAGGGGGKGGGGGAAAPQQLPATASTHANMPS